MGCCREPRPKADWLLSLLTPATRPPIESLDGAWTLECRVERFPLAPGEYWLKLGLATVGEELDEIERAVLFTVVEGDAFGDGRGHHRGVCVAPSTWTARNAVASQVAVRPAP